MYDTATNTLVRQGYITGIDFYMGIIIGLIVGFIFWNMVKGVMK
jgi:hypothetical protein